MVNTSADKELRLKYGHKMKVLVLIAQLAIAVPYNQLKSVRKTIRENRRNYVANAKMFERINKKLEANENLTQALQQELTQVKQELESVKAENLIFKADINKLKINSTDDYDYDLDYSSSGLWKLHTKIYVRHNVVYVCNLYFSKKTNPFEVSIQLKLILKKWFKI